MTCWLQWCVEIETRCRIPIWRTFERIKWHVIPEPRITLWGAATWWIHCHDSRATCHIAGCSHLTKSMLWSCHIAGCKNSIRHIENGFSPYFFVFFLQFRLWRAAAFVSSQIHLFVVRLTICLMSVYMTFARRHCLTSTELGVFWSSCVKFFITPLVRI